MHTAGDNKSHRKNVYDLEFQGQTFEIRKIISTFLISQASKMLESIQRSCLDDVYNQRYEGHTQRCLTSIFKVNHQGQVTDFGSSEILDIVNVRIDTKIKSAA